MTILVYLIHADPSVRSAYATELQRAGVDAELVIVNAGAFSSAYDKHAAKLRAAGSGSVLDGMLRTHQPQRPGTYDATIIASFSAGYALARAILERDDDAAEIDGYCAIDSIHAGLEADGTARDASLAWAVRYAKRAASGEVSCWVAHTDVATPQRGPGAFASTTQVVQELVRLAGQPVAGWRVMARDDHRDQLTEHRRALTGWGPAWLAGCVREVAERHHLTTLRPVRPIDLDPLGDRALRVAVAELDAGVAEQPLGSNSGPRIREYLAGCVRDGRRLGLTSGEWCAAAASWCALQARTRSDDDQIPHLWRAAVRELWADAVAAGAARPPEWLPSVGDLAILARVPGECPTRGGRGHVGRVELVSGGEYVTVDGNHGTAWGRVRRRFDDPQLRGWIAYPQRGSAHAGASAASLAAAATLRAAWSEVEDWLA